RGRQVEATDRELAHQTVLLGPVAHEAMGEVGRCPADDLVAVGGPFGRDARSGVDLVGRAGQLLVCEASSILLVVVVDSEAGAIGARLQSEVARLDVLDDDLAVFATGVLLSELGGHQTLSAAGT